jgi:hypothetical protein
LVVFALAVLVTFGAGPATAAPNTGRAPRYYLSLGDSLSRGVQPDPAGQNHPTDQGYADDLAKVGRLVLPQLHLVKLGCETEETTTSMLDGGRCAYAAAGPRVPIVGMNFYDPFLAAWLQGSAGQELARLSVQLVTQYNDLLEAAYRGAGVPVADVEAAFSTTDFDTLVTLPGVGQVPLNVARVCQWTWMCAHPPQGPNVHGRPEGYWVMAGVFVAALIQAHRLDHGPLASRSGQLGAALHHLDSASTDNPVQVHGGPR